MKSTSVFLSSEQYYTQINKNWWRCKLSKLTHRAKKKSVYKYIWRGVRAILTNVFLEQIRNSLKNLFLQKVLYVIKGCLKNLARAKNALRARKK